ncbi:hypothetical protein G5B31_08690 [Rhodobacter sp. SGA-6-6]|uniref:hypothetical protein n=1 Tax=Rhodobacter sp. SGA-6-6 TaxID=2710882 RepID=UPI0013ED8951|nr:hypothetical protein [Rhodobacter sp. SGA-6-6]NGM45610.1 hypothetical protein [Rhodobacter sp. SGA-6-6]
MRLLPAALALALAALPLPLAAEGSTEDGRVLLLPGDREVSDPTTGVTFRLTAVTDQRCPADVACVWEGMIRLEIEAVLAPDDSRSVILCNACDDGGRTADLPGMILRFEGLEPSTAELARRARLPVLQDYTASIALSAP